jgi:ATPase family associated with various cellular activities (AAA)
MTKNQKLVKEIINDGEWLTKITDHNFHKGSYVRDFEKYFDGVPFKTYTFNDPQYDTNIYKLSDIGFKLHKIADNEIIFIDWDHRIIITATSPHALNFRKGKFITNDSHKEVEISFFHLELNKARLSEVLTFILDKIITKPKKKDNFYLIAQSPDGLYNQRATFKNIPIKDNRYDLYYKDSFPTEKIFNFFNSDEENLMLFYGPPGCGKTNVVRNLIKKSKRPVIFIPPSMVSVLSDPSFISHMLDCRGYALVIEDCEQILSSDRNAATANLLNISDGILGNCLDLKILCSFNAPIKDVDKALLRKGRLYHSHCFDKLTIKESNDLAKFVDIDYVFTEESSLADIFNHRKTTSTLLKESNPIGFGNF